MTPPDSFKKFPFLLCVCSTFLFANFDFSYSIKKLIILKINILKINFKFLKNIIF
ncbi:hypothetical protein BDE02_04G024000 [Populus trichocarpa]|nr:hypothetical protein BDE02_04G024000 [Populus trichocarpa]